MLQTIDSGYNLTSFGVLCWSIPTYYIINKPWYQQVKQWKSSSSDHVQKSSHFSPVPGMQPMSAQREWQVLEWKTAVLVTCALMLCRGKSPPCPYPVNLSWDMRPSTGWIHIQLDVIHIWVWIHTQIFAKQSSMPAAAQTQLLHISF